MRLIDADAMIISDEECVNTMCRNCKMQVACCEDFKYILDNAPTIEERKTGEWIERNPQNSDKCRLIECDQCGFSHIVGFNVPYEHWIENRNFCERCGADMRKGEGEKE